MTYEIDTDDLDLSPDPTQLVSGNTATKAQIDQINRLMSYRDVDNKDSRRSLEIAREQWREGMFTSVKASKLILDLMETATLSRLDTPEGMHKRGEKIFKVQRSPRTGRLYAKRLDGVGDVDGPSKWTFNYAPGAIRDLSPETLMTLDEAKRFGALYGTCCACGRTLTDEESIAAGVGPVCARKDQWAA